MKRSTQICAKYALDRLVGTAALVAFAPLMAMIAVAIRLEDGGPAFYRQERPGLNRQPFRIWKFRTMVVNADDLLDDRGCVVRDRVTRVGRFLRFTSLDELPQVLNVVLGDMSFVGPRPAAMQQLKRLTEEQMGRFRMKPGITGLSQVNGRNRLKWSKRIEYDNEYIDGYSLLRDLEILARTIPVVLLRKGVSLDRNVEEVDDLPAPRS